MSKSKAKVSSSTEEQVTWEEFFENSTPNSLHSISNFGELERNGINLQKYFYRIHLPIIHLYCPTSVSCERGSFFDPEQSDFTISDESIEKNASRYLFANYQCRHCRKYKKTFALMISISMVSPRAEFSCNVIKLGESPAYAPITSSKLKKLIKEDRDRFMKGRMAESYGLGIGAFAYYRQVVEKIRIQLFDEIIRVAKLKSGNEELIEEIENAKNETQFSKAVSQIKHSLPDTLLYKGHNPLTLLHDALSSGIHSGTDSECLDFAQTIRLLLADLAERIDFVLKDEKQIDAGISRLINRKS